MAEIETPEEDLTKKNAEPSQITEPSISEAPYVGDSQDSKEILISDVSEEAEKIDRLKNDIQEQADAKYEEIGENGAIKTVEISSVMLDRRDPENIRNSQIKEYKDEEEEEYEDEEIDENGQLKIVKRKRLVKSHKTVISTADDENYTEEGHEENEIEETRDVKKMNSSDEVPKENPIAEPEESYDEVEEEYEEDEENENGLLVSVIKKRIVKVPKKITISKEALEGSESTVEGHEKDVSKASHSDRKEQIDEVVEKDEKMGDEVEETEEIEEKEKTEGEEEGKIEDEGGVTEEEALRKEGLKSEGSQDVEEFDIEDEKKKATKQKITLSKEAEERGSKVDFETHKEGKITEGEGTEVKEETSDLDDKSVALSMSSAELRQVQERAAIVEQFQILSSLRNEHINLKKKSFFLTNKLVQYFKKQKMDYVFAETKEDANMEQRYFKKLMEFYETNQQNNEAKLKINTDWEHQLAINEELTEKNKHYLEELMSHKREVAAKLIDSRTGRTILNDKAIEDLLLRQENQFKQLSDCRLIQIKLRRRIDSQKEERQMDNMGMDFNLMDYEKLSSLKEYYMDKITERDIEIEEVSQKMAVMDDNLSLVKEQLRQKEEEMENEQLRVQRISSELNRKRANLNRLKASRHKIEKNTAKIKKNSGLLPYPTLLRDYEEKTQQLKDLTAQTDALKHSFKNGVILTRKLRETVRKKPFTKT